MKSLAFLLLISGVYSCNSVQTEYENVITTDVVNFWIAYDFVTRESDTLKQVQLIDSLYIQKGTEGLKSIMEVRDYSAKEYVDLINKHPKYFASIRPNTSKSSQLAQDLNDGIKRLEAIYPYLKPAKIYFTIGCMRTNGTTLDSLVLIGSELAMADDQTDISEFDWRTKEWLETFFGTNPIDDLVLLNVHEYVHTQQKPQVFNLLSTTLREGVAEFVSVKAMNVHSATPAIQYGKENANRVRQKFEDEMFYIGNQPKWLWSNAPNEFGIRDLGYYVGYQMCENYYEQAGDKKKAIKEMIELDFTNEGEIEEFVSKTNYFSSSLDSLRQKFEAKRPYVKGIRQFTNNSDTVDPSIDQITVEFSESLNGLNTGVDFGDLGQEYFPQNDPTKRFWSEDNASWTIPVNLDPNRQYQILISSNFRTNEGFPLKSYLIDFKTHE